jgi:ATP-dependent helicase HrpA
LSFVRVREWREVHRQLEQTVRELRLPRPAPVPRSEGGAPLDAGVSVHLALLSGLLSRIGQYQPEQRSYQGSRQTRFAIHPGSAVAKKPPAWVMAFELVQTSQLFARTVAKLEPEWLDQVAGHLLKRSYSEPHWSEKSARASVREHATLFGLPVLRDRSVDYATLAPGRARLIFLEHALVRNEYASPGAFQQKNRALLAEVARLRDKARQSDMLADDDALLAFFERVVPDAVVNGKTFELWRETAERKQPNLLCLSIRDVLAAGPTLEPNQYPDELTLQGVRFELGYCFDPSADHDGVTLTVPLPVLPRLLPLQLEWTIPAWHEQKILELLQTLPKPVRRCLEPLADAAATLAAQLTPFQGGFLQQLAQGASQLARVPIDEAALRLEAIPRHLRFNFRIVTEHGKVLAEGRDLAALLEAHTSRAREALGRERTEDWQKLGIVTWEFGDLPACVTRRVMGVDVLSYPALVDCQSSVALKLQESRAEAEKLSRTGVCRLIILQPSRPLAAVAKRIPSLQLSAQPASREALQFRDRMLLRVTEAAFLPPGTQLPRTRQQFEQVAQRGIGRLDAAAGVLTGALTSVASELGLTLQAIKKAASQPSGTSAVREVTQQLEQLFDLELLSTVELARLSHYPRYLRAIQTRLLRAVLDPRKDADKLAPLTPVWQDFLNKPQAVRDQEAARSLRFAFEELRVAIFAPELKPAFAVTALTLSQAVKALR